MPFKDGCNKEGCSASTGIHDPESSQLSGMTFGSGRLDDHGYWEFPCHLCARAFEKLYPEAIPCWPYEDNSYEPERTYTMQAAMDRLDEELGELFPGYYDDDTYGIDT